MNTTYIIYFLVLAIACNGLAKLYLYLIQPEQLFSFVQKWIKYFATRNDFIYRSLGGCKVCTVQRFAELSYILLSVLFFNGWVLTLVFYPLFCGLVFYFSELTNRPINPIVNQQKLDL
jgi:hypothetical protein